MSKKYLSLEEAAERLGLTVDQLLQVRDDGEIRGFADRGSWKFREEDVEEFQRSRQADSTPDFPIISAGTGSGIDDDDELSSSDSDVRLAFDDDLFADDEDDADILKDSGSDLRLSGDSGPGLSADEDQVANDEIDLTSWEPEVSLSDSDSDVQLAREGSDADVDLDAMRKE